MLETHLIAADDFTTGFLDLVQLTEIVPEARLCDDLVRGKDTHPVELGRWHIFGRKMATNNLIFDKCRHDF